MLQRAFPQHSLNRVVEDKLFWNNPALPSSRGPGKAQRSAASLARDNSPVASSPLANSPLAANEGNAITAAVEAVTG